jgi:hypothetical protein
MRLFDNPTLKLIILPPYPTQSVFARGFNELDDKILNLIAFKKAMAKEKNKRFISLS